jgi:hypothetical protein
MGTIRPTAEQAAKRHRRRGFLLLTVGALILLAGVLIALSVEVDVRGQNPGASPPPPGGFDWSGIIAALIGAVPGTITAVTGLIIVMRSRTELPAPTPVPSQPQAPPPPSKP